jgi:hydrogenase maturation protein HypF
MAEHGVADGQRVIGFAFDGTGYGSDGAIWGGEVLVAGYDGFERASHSATCRCRAATRRSASRIASRSRTCGPPASSGTPIWLRFVPRGEERGCSSVSSSAESIASRRPSAGRLFDAVSSLLGIRHVVSYEAQAAIELETVAEAHLGSACDYRIAIGGDDIDVAPVLRAMIDDLRDGRAPGAIAAGFHVAVARLIAEMAEDLRVRTGLERVALSGGVFQNVLLVRLTRAQLAARDFNVSPIASFRRTTVASPSARWPSPAGRHAVHPSRASTR